VHLWFYLSAGTDIDSYILVIMYCNVKPSTYLTPHAVVLHKKYQTARDMKRLNHYFTLRICIVDCDPLVGSVTAVMTILLTQANCCPNYI